MPIYQVIDNDTNERVRFQWDGDKPPTDTDLQAVFAAHRNTKKDGSDTIEDGSEKRKGWLEGGFQDVLGREAYESIQGLKDSLENLGGLGQKLANKITGQSGMSLSDLITGETPKDPSIMRAAMAPLHIGRIALAPLTAAAETYLGAPAEKALDMTPLPKTVKDFVRNSVEDIAYVINPSMIEQKIAGALAPTGLKLTEQAAQAMNKPARNIINNFIGDTEAIPKTSIPTATQRLKKDPVAEFDFQNMMDDIEKTYGSQAEAGGIAYGQELPKYAGGNTGINLGLRGGGDNDVERLINLEVERNKLKMMEAKQSGAKTGVRTFAETKALGEKFAEMVGEDAGTIIKTASSKTNDLAEWMYAANQVLHNEMKKLSDMIKTAAISGDPAHIEQVKALMQVGANIVAEIGGAGSKIGRALNAQKILSSGIQGYNGLIGTLANSNLTPDMLRDMALMNPWELGKFVKNVVNPKFFDYFRSYWYNSILSGIPTHIVNTVSNTAWQAFQIPYKILRGAVDFGLSKAEGRTQEYYMREAIPNLVALRAGLRSGVAKGLQVLRNGVVTDTTKMSAEMNHIAPFAFSPSPVMRRLSSPLGKPSNPIMQAISGSIGVEAPSRLLQASDVFFKGIAYEAERHAIGVRMALKEGKKGDELAKRALELSQSDYATKKATEYASYVTFTDDPGAITKTILKFRNTGTLMDPIATVLMPFVSTPANILKRGLEMTPGVGAVMLRKADKAEAIAKQMIGGVIATYFGSHYLDGNLTGALPDNSAEIDEWSRQHKTPWSIKIGDHWVEYRRWEPFNTAIAAVASVLDAFKKDPSVPIEEKAYNAALDVAQNVLDASYLSGLSGIVETIESKRRNPEDVNSLVAQFGSSLVPFSGFAKSIAKTVDAIRSEGEGVPIKDPKGIVEGIKASLPGLRDDVPNRLNNLGDVKIKEGGWLRQFLPYKWTTENADEMEAELRKSESKVGRLSDKIDGQKLTREQYYIYRQRTGALLKERLKEITSNPAFKSYPQDQKNEMIKQAISEAHEDGKEDMRIQLQKMGASLHQREDVAQADMSGMSNPLVLMGGMIAGFLTHKPGMMEEALKAEQGISSALTNVNKVPRSFRKIPWQEGATNLDIGGGRFDTPTEFLAKEKGVTNYVVDPFNRPAEHNASVLAHVKQNPTDTATAMDVLNVIKEPEIRQQVIKQAAEHTKPNGVAYFQVYEGDKSGVGRVTKASKEGEALTWQNNKKLDEYIPEIEKHFEKVYKHGDYIIAEKSASTKTPEEILATLPESRFANRSGVLKFIADEYGIKDYSTRSRAKNLNMFTQEIMPRSDITPYEKGRIYATLQRHTAADITSKGNPYKIYSTKIPISQNDKATGSKVLQTDTIRGCGNDCVDCYAAVLAGKSGLTHTVEVPGHIQGRIKPENLLRIGTSGDPAGSAASDFVGWEHTNKEISSLLARSPGTSSEKNIYFISKLQRVDGFNPKIVRNLEVSLDPLNPSQMKTAMKNILTIKRLDPTVKIVTRIRTFKSLDYELNLAQEAAQDFAKAMGLNTLETKMRFKSKAPMQLLDIDNRAYVRKGNQYKLKEPVIGNKPNNFICDEGGTGKCINCMNCSKVFKMGFEKFKQIPLPEVIAASPAMSWLFSKDHGEGISVDPGT